MNAKQYKVMKALMDCRGEWIPTHELARRLNLTWRQASSILKVLSPPLEIRRDEKYGVAEARFNGTDEEMLELEKQALKDIYGIDEAERERIYRSLSPYSWISMVDLADELGYKFSVILRVFATMEGIEETRENSIKLFRRKSDV